MVNIASSRYFKHRLCMTLSRLEACLQGESKLYGDETLLGLYFPKINLECLSQVFHLTLG